MAAEEEGIPSSVEINGTEYKPLADGKYDVIVLGTGLKECILGGLLAIEGKKVLVLDRNPYYGGECASLNLSNLWQKFVDPNSEPAEDFFKQLGHNRDYNVDLVPKFIFADGLLVQILIKTGVTNYLDFKQVGGSFVYKSDGSVHKVPATEYEAMKTGLVGFFQKRKLRNFLQYIAKYKQDDPSTHEGFDMEKGTARQLMDKFGCDENTVDFVGHAMALQPDDSYLDKPAAPFAEAVKLYGSSLEKYGTSPFIYPVYGLGGLPESFSRLCAINGGIFMLNQDIDEILYGPDGKFAGVRAGEQAASASMVIGDPSYFNSSRVKHTGKVIRSICLMDHPISAIKDQVGSAQIILPQKQVGRNNDIYISMLGNDHEVTAKGIYAAIISTTVETNEAKKEVNTSLLGKTITRFDNIVDTWEPAADGTEDNVYITRSYDATSHFESISKEVLELYRRITGNELDLSPKEE
eukprot:gb/GECG01015820.1/.p1 GENE.gb/GECG01015820.1/~~gb/GECG01015820.1/.p1  ORF type:complete len:465 (+),score=69.10 gb/GECG01015820.1/:1-1395(+)